MATIQNPSGKPLTSKGSIGMPCMLVPSMRASLAKQNGNEKNFLIYVNGGLGDAICAEPAIRYATETFKDCTFTIASYWPELYRHLRIENEINFFTDPRSSESFYETHFVFKTLFQADDLHSEFIPHMFTHVVDYSSLSMFRVQLPDHKKNIMLLPDSKDFRRIIDIGQSNIVIHPGRTWQSRTIPAEYWNEIIQELRNLGHVPVIIGQQTLDPKLGTVDINTIGCIDMRDKLSIMETVALLQFATVVLTNDSSPIHMASSGNAWIGMLSTVKHPDLLFHYRDGKKGYRQKNLTTDGLWNYINMNPNNSQMFRFDEIDPDLLMSWLPDPEYVANWASNKRRFPNA